MKLFKHIDKYNNSNNNEEYIFTFGKNYYKIRETHHYLIIRIPIKIRVKEYFNIETNTYECACCNPVWYFGYNFKFDKIFTWSKI